MGRQTVQIGEVVEGRYRIIRPIAEGGMGTVFLAEHWLIKRRVAIKVLHAELATDAVMIRRFMNEALAAGTLGHPNIVESTDMGFTKSDIPYIVFEYLEGTPLADEVNRLGSLPVARALKIAHQIASALEAAHDADIIHRDLKSDNIFLTDKGEEHDHVKVLDFGISRFLAASDKTGVGGNLLGTPEFMAPEQIMTPEQIDRRADIYALGVVLYEMLAGKVPFGYDTPPNGAKKTPSLDVEAAHRLLGRIVNEPPPPLVRDDAPPGLVEMLGEKLLAKNPDERYQSMADVQASLAAFAGIMAKPVTIPPPLGKAPRPATDPMIAEISDMTVSRSRLERAEFLREVQQLGKRWSLAGDDLVCDVYSREMAKLAAAVGSAAAIADEMEHHPKISIQFPHLRLTITRATNVVDLVFAARLEAWLRDNGW
ncbi:MAG: serine/threonine protein kinase [Kofleriaceae bacterium]|nr:serine/threonine protein kinase [Kofleriaceae bacterium]